MASVVNKRFVKTLLCSWVSKNASINYAGIGLKNEYSIAALYALGPCTLAGQPFIDVLVEEYGCTVQWHVTEGDVIAAGRNKVATITGTVSDLMHCEQLTVTIMSRACGIATLAKKLYKNTSSLSWDGKLRVPRCLTPGFEVVEEYALLIAGVLGDKNGVLVKYDLAEVSGGIKESIERIRSSTGPFTKIEVECNTSEGAMQAANAGADLVLLDQLHLKDLNTCVTKLKESNPSLKVQANGAIDCDNMKLYALSGVDFLSTSKFTHGYPAIKFQFIHEASNNSGDSVVKTPENPPSVQPTPQSQETAPADPVTSPSPTPKKPRLDDAKETPNSTTGSKQNGLPRNTPTPTVSNTEKTTGQQNQKRTQRQRSQQNTLNQQRRDQPNTGAQTMVSPRFSSPNAPVSRQMVQSGISPQNQAFGSRLPGQQSMGARMSTPGHPGMLGSGPNLTPAFLGMQAQQQNTPNWSAMMSGGTGPMMGGVGFGMRMGSPGGMNIPVCRNCGINNPPGQPYCRNCRSPIR